MICASRSSYIEHRHRWGWYVVYPAARADVGMATETGPYLTHLGARLSRLIWGD